ncbi:MAG: hypothetical protein JOY70_02880 [Acidisphaera sp.]|nr:hypothetical protein [Acidisphaera sp.]MBV9813455.1 hypothetical protein [Acetobacteraceae bacterium]
MIAKLPVPADVFQGELAERAEWVVAIVIHNSGSGEILSRVDPFFSSNTLPNFEHMTLEIRKWENLARERRAEEQRVASHRSRPG